jgi:hypothetical protein
VLATIWHSSNNGDCFNWRANKEDPQGQLCLTKPKNVNTPAMTFKLDVSPAASITEPETWTVSVHAVKDVDDMPAFEIPVTLTSQVHDRPQ